MLKQSGWGLWVARMGCGLILLTGGACGGDDTDDTASNIKGNTGGKAAGEAGRGGSSASASRRILYTVPRWQTNPTRWKPGKQSRETSSSMLTI